MSRKNRPITPASTLAALATTNAGAQGNGIADVVNAETHQDDNLAGDIAAAAATGDATGLIQDGAVAIEASKTVDGSIVADVVIEPRPNGDLPGDTAAAAIGAEAIVPLPDVRSIPLRLRGEGSVIVAKNETVFTDTPESEPVNGEAGNPAGLSADNAAIIDLHPAWADAPEEDEFQKSYPRTFALFSGHRGSTPPVLRITPTKPGFRRGGIAHPAGPTDYPAFSLTPFQIEAILAELTLVVEVI